MARPKGLEETTPLHTRLTASQLAGFRKYVEKEKEKIKHTGYQLTDAAVLRGMILQCLDRDGIAHSTQQALTFAGAAPAAPPVEVQTSDAAPAAPPVEVQASDAAPAAPPVEVQASDAAPAAPAAPPVEVQASDAAPAAPSPVDVPKGAKKTGTKPKSTAPAPAAKSPKKAATRRPKSKR